ncbi:disease resistance protein RGA2-like [Solanum tuberosum]|uniref:disease resistance protein RGA2-like n=1 Tax=Solanum tuberosum TaxID=4113 RepID=UPI00073A18A5|nr:PREDICTED: disease resistance protein RGA2-like [Solanum tuberosum]
MALGVTYVTSDAQTLPVLPILGMGGLGKTTLAQMIFNDQRVTEHFNLKIWVCVSDDFEEKRLIKTIVESIEGKLVTDMDLAPHQKKVQDLLNGKRYLLVLDDVWNENQGEWDNIKAVLKVGARGASVLVTTRLERVGLIMGTLQPYELSNLSQEDCWSLFMQRAFGQEKEINPNLEAIGKEIVKKCGGVPLAAKTLGGILRFKREEREWEHVRDSEIWNLPQDERSIMPALRLSYHHLPLDLRQCFEYCVVFPKDTEMEKQSLISLWMAHGFLLSKGNLENCSCLPPFGDLPCLESLELQLGPAEYVEEVDIDIHLRTLTTRNIRESEEATSLPEEMFKNLANLKDLKISNFKNLRELPTSLASLNALKSLKIHMCDALESLPEEGVKGLTSLTELYVCYCKMLKRLPEGLQHLTTLTNLGIWGCPEVEKRCEKGIGEDWHKTAHIPYLKIYS